MVKTYTIQSTGFTPRDVSARINDKIDLKVSTMSDINIRIVKNRECDIL